MAEKPKQKLIKATLSSGKVVYFREPRIADSERAAQLAAPAAGDNAILLPVMMNRQLVTLLIHQIGEDVPLTPVQREQLDDHLTPGEYAQCLKVIGKLMGSDEAGKEPTIAFHSG